MKFNEMKYERPSLDDYKKKFIDIIENIKNAKDYNEFKSLFFEFDKQLQHISTLATLCSIRNSINTTDEFYEKETAFWDESMPSLFEYSSDFIKAIFASKFIDELKKDVSHTFFKQAENELKAYSSEIVEDLVIENKLGTEYSKLLASAKIEFDGEIKNLAQMGVYATNTDRNIRKEASLATSKFFLDNESEFDRIFDELVKVRTRIAKKLGFNSFTELAYIRMNRLDYNQNDVERYRKEIIKYVLPVVKKIYDAQSKRIGIDELMAYDLGLKFIDGNAKPTGTPEEILEAGRKMYHELSPETSEFIDLMIDNELMDVLAKPGKRTGGYMTFLPDYGVPFIFSNFNGTSGDVDVLTHEAGHAFQGYQSKGIIHEQNSTVHMPTMESCEIHSMSMEFITWPWMEYFFGDKADKYRFSHICSGIEFLPYGVEVDHFQHEVYNNPDMTPDERKALWAKLDKIYRPYHNFEGNELLERGCWWFRQAHIFNSPFYYIDYTLAQVCAFQFWKRIHVDKDETAWNDYLAICKCGGTKSFTEIVKLANLKNPFKEGALEEVISAIDKYIEENKSKFE